MEKETYFATIARHIGAISSVVEHFVDIEGAGSSILPSRTK